jgi:hypothetical protein
MPKRPMSLSPIPRFRARLPPQLLAASRTNTLPYTLALDATSITDTQTNLAYTVALSAASGVGSGVAQTYSVTGSMASGQAGTCAAAGGACTNGTSANKVRTLTITY